MFCSPSSQHGFIQIVGPIQQTDLDAITVQSSPLRLSFATRSTPPSLVASYIVEASPSDNTCTYKGKKYPLLDIQLTTAAHHGFMLPGMTQESWGELVLTFGAAGSMGLVLVFPLYTSTSPTRSEYLTALHAMDPSHPDSVRPPTLETLFRTIDTEKQVAFGYTTCYETIAENQPTTNSLYVSVFPHGIQLLPADTETLKTSLRAYRIPVSLRGPDPTLRTYTLNQRGQKQVSTTSDDGELYTSAVSSCSAEFKTIEFCALPPTLVSLTGSKTVCGAPAADPSKPANYKCVPMEQLRDAKGQYIKLGSKTLESILAEQQQVQASAGIAKQSGDQAQANTEVILEIAGTAIILLIGGVGCYMAWKATQDE